MNSKELCWCQSGEEYGNCHAKFDKKLKQLRQKGIVVPSHKIIKTKPQIEGIRESGKINVAILDEVSKNIKEGMTTEEIDQIVYNKTKELGGIPAPLGFEGFPKSVCTSINNQVCHGIPSKEDVLKSGDIINVDVSTIYNNYYSDSSRMFCIGEVSEDMKKLVEVTKECVALGVKEVKPWGRLGDIGDAINSHAMKNGYKVVREVGGHGVGNEFHEKPYVNHVARKGTGMLLVPGMIFTIEPMVNMGTADIFIDEGNGWTIYTDDEKPSAQWEVMVLVTDEGYEVLAW